MRASSPKVGTEPIPGYVLRKRLGAGGYGEVWLADAPGGLQKAVKLIHGSVDESQAASELKSLERIRQVSHPFLLSLERIEVIGEQVVIVTELADESLQDCYQSFRRKGDPGIPRSQLLDYLRDSADGLDFLAQKHSLQHLDVKPGNLLLLANRVKVADFGLVKNLQETNQSLVSGLTPTYSGPEIFDGRPDFRSDQYSLAIVYMELLTGHLPFDGSTTGELARQHLSQPPNLEALPPSDRAIVKRALSKNPMDRYSNCRQLIDNLAKQKATALPDLTVEKKTEKPESALSSSNDERSTDQTLAPQCEFQPALNLTNREAFENPRSLFVGIGEIGCQSLANLYNRIDADCDSRLAVDDFGWLALDTAAETLEDMVMDGFAAGKAVKIPVFKPSEYRDADPELFVPLSRRWLYNIPKSCRTEGVRPIAVLAFLDHYEHLKAKVLDELRPLVNTHLEEQKEQPLRIYVMASTHGGTGSGLVSELAFVIRVALRELDFHNYRISAAMTLATTTNSASASLPAAAALSCLSELSHMMAEQESIPSIYYGDRNIGNSAKPFDWVTLIDGGLYGNGKDAYGAYTQLSNFVYVDSHTLVSAHLKEFRLQAEGNFDWLRFAKTQELEVVGDISEQYLTRNCAKQVIARTCDYLTGHSANNTCENSATISGDLPLTEDAQRQIRERFFQGLNIQPRNGTDEQAQIANRELATTWVRRLSSIQEIHAQQLNHDCDTWARAIHSLVKTRLYNWRQINRVQLTIIEALVETAESGVEPMAECLRGFHSILEKNQIDVSSEQFPQQISNYLKKLSENFLLYTTKFRQLGSEMAKRYRSWNDSLSAESNQQGSHVWDGNVATLPSQLQVLVGRVTSELEQSAIADTLTLLDGARQSLRYPNVSLPSRSLSQFLKHTQELFIRTTGHLSISQEMLTSKSKDEQTRRPLMEFSNMLPSVSQFGGEFHRFLVASPEQMEAIQATLKSDKLLSTTTLVAGTSSNMGAFAFMEGSRFGIPRVLATLFRPVPATLQLAERLRTRTDIEWQPVEALFENADAENRDQWNKPLVAPAAPVPNSIPILSILETSCWRSLRSRSQTEVHRL